MKAVESNNLKKICHACQSCCCKNGAFFSSPILSLAEAAAIISRFPESQEIIQEVKGPTGEYYYTFSKTNPIGSCHFLDSKYRCKIYNIKPLDCQSYPIRAVHSYANIKFIVDKNCPASTNLHYKFIRNCREIARQSINRFDKETYRHWLENNVGLAKIQN